MLFRSVSNLQSKKFLFINSSKNATRFSFVKTCKDICLLSFHGRVPSDEDLKYYSGRIIGMLTDNKFNSNAIATYLIARGWDKNARAYICSRLSYPDEKIVSLSLDEAQTKACASHCVMIVEG